MQNPLESEETAFRFVLGALVYFAPIVLAAWIATWLGVIVFVVMSVAAFVALRRKSAAVPAVISTERAAVEDTRRILVVTDALPIGPRLREAIERFAETVTEDVLLIYAVTRPAAAGGDGGGAGLPDAEALAAAVNGLRSGGINARGAVAPGAVLDALEDALRRHDVDHVVISITVARSPAGGEPLSPPRSLAAGAVAASARTLFGGAVTMIVEDTEH
jgi:hypothetical protein